MHKKLERLLTIAFLVLTRILSLPRLCALYLQVFLNGGQASISPSVIIKHPLRFQGRGRLTIERNVTFGFALAGAIGIPILLQPRETGSVISIGSGSQIMNGCEFIARSAIYVGEKCQIGARTQILDADFHGIAPEARNQPGKTAPVVIENNVLIGIGATILKGVHIGKDAVIGARCVVANDVPAGAIVAGNPMCIIGSVYRSAEETDQC